jgi:iron complex outermembrane receptor protein
VGHGVTAIVDTANPWTTNANEPQSTKSSNLGSSVQADWNAPGGFTVTSISAARVFTFNPVNNSGLTVYAPAANAPIYSSNANDHDVQASEEFRVASPLGGDIDYVAGLYYFFKDLAGRQRNYYGNLYSALTGASNAPLNNATLAYDSLFHTNSAAAYGQANWRVTDQLTLTAGLRESYEADGEQFIRYGLTGGTGTPPSNTIPYNGQGSISNWNTGGLLSLSYKLTDDVLTYASLSHGAKSGGFVGASAPTQTGTSFAPFSTLELKPESSDDAELGVKSGWFDQHIILNADAFYTRVGNYQVAATVTTTTGIAAAGVNVQSLVSKGFEVELTALPFEGLNLAASSSYNDAAYGSFTDAPPVQGATGVFQNLSGRPVNGVPLWTGSISATYTVPLTQDVAGYLSGEYAYKSGQYGYIDDSPYSWIKAYGLANFRAGLNFDEHYDVALWVRNVFNTPNFDVVGPLSGNLGGYYASVGAPRVYGVTIAAKL